MNNEEMYKKLKIGEDRLIVVSVVAGILMGAISKTLWNDPLFNTIKSFNLPFSSLIEGFIYLVLLVFITVIIICPLRWLSRKFITAD